MNNLFSTVDSRHSPFFFFQFSNRTNEKREKKRQRKFLTLTICFIDKNSTDVNIYEVHILPAGRLFFSVWICLLFFFLFFAIQFSFVRSFRIDLVNILTFFMHVYARCIVHSFELCELLCLWFAINDEIQRNKHSQNTFANRWICLIPVSSEMMTIFNISIEMRLIVFYCCCTMHQVQDSCASTRYYLC